MTLIKAKFKNLTKNGFSGFLESEKGDLFFSLSQARNAGYSDGDFVKGREFEVEIEPNNRSVESYKVKKFITTSTIQQKQNQPTTTQQPNVKSIIDFKMESMNINYSLFLNKPHHKLIGNIANGDIKLEPRKEQIETLTTKNKKGFQFFETEKKELDFLSALKKRHIENAKVLLGINNVDTSICLKPDWRMALGLGGASVYETSITLHHIYGIPYIPASGLKGVVRSWIITEFFGSEQSAKDEKEFPLLNAEFRAYQDENFCKIFGCPVQYEKIEFQNGKPIFQMKKGKKKYKTEFLDVILKNNKGKVQENEGKITFFDAFPTDKINISLDIMNVHYKDYYNSQEKDDDGNYKPGTVKPPADWSTPNIINFLTVQDTSFQFLVGAKNESDLNLKIGNKTIIEWLKDALENHGIGAKTAVGYGYMQEK